MQEQIFVGRQRQLEELNEHLRKALDGHGQVCFVTGEAGAGKTALVRQFVQQAFAREPDLIVAVGSCNAQTGVGDPYLPFREALAMLTGDGSTQPSAAKVAPQNDSRLRVVLARSVQVLVEVAPDLVGLFVPGAKLLGAVGKAVATKVGWMDRLERLAKRPSAPAVEQSHIFEQYTAFLQRFSTKTPLILFLDDLQWADSASVSLLFHLGRRIEASRILILGAYRPNDVALGRDEGRHPLEPVVNELTRYYGDVTVDLDTIPERTSRQFVDALLDSEPNLLGEAFREALFHQTGGHALFTVELIRDMQERGDLVLSSNRRWIQGAALDWSDLPARVEGVIAERIARLDRMLQEMLTIASVEGEVFRAEVIARIEAMTNREAIRHLSDELERQHHLVTALSVVHLASLRLSLYRFVHNLFQQYLYNNLDEAERMSLHYDVSQALEALFGDQTEEVAAQLAHHFEGAGIPAKAVAYRLQAGGQAYRMSAHLEAAAHLRRGLELLAQLPEGSERVQLELALQALLGMVLMATNGYAAPEVERAYGRARELCLSLGDPPQTVPVLFGLCLYYLVHGEVDRARGEGEQLLRLTQQVEDIGYQIGCHYLLGATALYRADLGRSRRHLEQVVTLYDPNRDRDLAYQQGQDPAVVSLLYLSWVLWFQGYPEQATPKMEEALRLAAALDHPYTHTLAAFFAGTFHQLMGQWPQCQAQAERALELAGQEHFTCWQAGCTILRGSALVQQGHVEEGIAVLRQGLAGWEAVGAQLALPYFRARLAEAYLIAGRREEGLKALDESLSHPEEVWWLPEQHRLRGELLLLGPGAEAEAEAALRQSLEVARRQRSRSLELRAASSLARLLQGQGRAAEDRDLLSSEAKQTSVAELRSAQ